MTDAARLADEVQRLSDASQVVYGPEGSRAWRDLMYTLYVITLLGSIYFFTTARAVVITVAAWWSGLGGRVWPVYIVVAALVLAAFHRAGRRVGPVTAPLAWIDLVVASPLDRSLTLREHWAIKVTGLIAAGFLMGMLLGAALWGGGATGWAALVVSPLLAASFGWLIATAWFAGQLATEPPPGHGSPRRRRPMVPATPALRWLSLHGVRVHSRRALLFAGALYTGDLRLAQLEIATPVSRGRRRQLRPRGRVTVITRDLLGLRRQPFLLLTGLGLGILGWLVLGYAIAERAPWTVIVVALLSAHLGCRRTGDGLRLFGDTLAAPPLLGMTVRGQALAHSVVPGLLTLLAGLPGWLLLELRGESLGLLVRYVLTVLAVTSVSLAVQWIDTLRVRTPSAVPLPEQGPIILALSWLWPVALATGIGYLITTRIATFLPGTDPPGLVIAPVLAALALGWLARRTLAGR